MIYQDTDLVPNMATLGYSSYTTVDRQIQKLVSDKQLLSKVKGKTGLAYLVFALFFGFGLSAFDFVDVFDFERRFFLIVTSLSSSNESCKH